MSDDLLKRLETGHDKECAMSYGMHEHCCDCSYPTRQEAAARVRELEAEIERLRDELRGRTQNFDDACTTLAKVEADLLTLQSRHERVLIAGAEVRERAERAEAERDAVMALSAQADRHRDELLAENERLRHEHIIERDALRYVIERAAAIMRGDGVEDQGEAYDQTLKLLDAAIDQARKPTPAA